jgi:hypothetical protein
MNEVKIVTENGICTVSLRGKQPVARYVSKKFFLTHYLAVFFTRKQHRNFYFVFFGKTILWVKYEAPMTQQPDILLFHIAV